MKNYSLLILFLFAPSLCFGGEWFVSPHGNDNNPGTKEKPFQTIIKARDTIRETKTSGAHTVHLSEDVFEIASPILFDERDSGTAAEPIRYIGGTGNKTLISGGQKLIGWKKESDEVWSVDVRQDLLPPLYFEQLFVNGRRAVRARTPNNGFFRPQEVQQNIPITEKNPPTGVSAQSIVAQNNDLDFLKTVPKEELRFGQFVIHHHWDTTRRILLGYDSEQNRLLMKGGVMKHWNPWRETSLYYIENVRPAFDQPGEWFYDGANLKAYYRPLPGETIENCAFTIPRSGVHQLLLLKGTPEKRVAHIQFENITFACTDSPRRIGLMSNAELGEDVTGDLKLPGPSQFDPEQAAFYTSAVIDVENADAVTFTDCEITNIGEYAFWFKNSDHCRVERCALTELGAGGIRIGGVGSSKHNVLNNNIIHRGGRLHASAVAVWVGNNTEDNQITHNDIGDFYYTGISAGWVWGYKGGAAFRNRFEFNRIHDLGQGAMADMGGVYTLGTSHGTRVCNNVIYNVLSYAYGGWGLYPDEGSEGILMENNLVYDTSDGSFHQHYGKNNHIRNNILAFSVPHQVAVTRVEPHRSLTFENNIIYWDEGKALGYQAEKARIDFGSNLWYGVDADGKPAEIDFKGKTHQDWLALGKDVGGMIADPKFVDAKNRDFRLQPDSPALQLGFVPFDFSKAGVYGEASWIKRAKDFVPPVHPMVPPVKK